MLHTNSFQAVEHEALFSDVADQRVFIDAFKQCARQKRVSGLVCTVYALARGRDLLGAFSPVRNPAKLANGRKPYDTLTEYLSRLARGTVFHKPRLWDAHWPWAALSDQQIFGLTERAQAALKRIVNHTNSAQAQIKESRA